MAVQFDYYYGMQADQFTFYRIPKILFKDSYFKGLSCEAKLLYGLMLDRMSLSMKNKWVDEHNRVYIYYTMENIMEDLGCAKEKCTKIVGELDSKKGIGLIEKKRQGLGKPDKIFVKNFISRNLSKEKDWQNPEVRKSNFKNAENQTSGSSIFENAEYGKSTANYTEKNDTDYNNNESNLITSGNDEMREDQIYGQIIKENIEYDALLKIYPTEKSTIEGIYDLMLETMLCKTEFLMISSNPYPTELVKSKFMKLDSGHIQYVLECLKKNTSSVRNIKKYLLATLFNAPSTIDSYYQAAVNQDMLRYATIKD